MFRSSQERELRRYFRDEYRSQHDSDAAYYRFFESSQSGSIWTAIVRFFKNLKGQDQLLKQIRKEIQEKPLILDELNINLR